MQAERKKERGHVTVGMSPLLGCRQGSGAEVCCLVVFARKSIWRNAKTPQGLTFPKPDAQAPGSQHTTLLLSTAAAGRRHSHLLLVSPVPVGAIDVQPVASGHPCAHSHGNSGLTGH